MCGQICAQAPGYIGKKTPITVEGLFFPNLLFKLGSQHPLRLNTRYGASFERVISRQVSVGLSWETLRTKTRYDFDMRTGSAEIEGYAFAFDMKFYTFNRRGNIAPLGPYQKISVFYIPFSMRDQDLQFYPNIQRDLGRYSDLGISLTMGSQRIWQNTYTYHWGIRTGWLLNAFQRETTPETIYLKELGTVRLRGHWGFSFNLGFGILLF